MYKDVVWLSLNDAPARGYWDQQLLEDIFVNKTHHTALDGLKQAIVVIPTPAQNPKDINAELAKLDECIVICTSDEHHKFDIAKLKHLNMKLYSMYAYKTKADVTWLPIGYTPHSKTKGYKEKDIDIYFGGQVNHKSRKDMVEQISQLPNATLDVSGGFAQGLDRPEYMSKVQRAKVVPAPAGNISPDSFRLYEALEHGAVPVAENPGFFDMVFKDYPFPVVTDRLQWQDYAHNALEDFPTINNKCSAWWQRYKANLYKEFNEPDELTVVIPVSPIKSHPSTDILDETIASIRKHSDAEIIVTFDGVRPEQEDRRADYELFINNFLSSGHERIRPIIFNEHTHQVGMMRNALDVITTPLVLYVEQDTPLTDDPIDWDKCKAMIQSDKSDLIRFHFEAFIPEVHEYLMLGHEDGFTQTIQWSQRPHLASTDYYRRILEEHFTPGAISFIEDKMHSVVQEAHKDGSSKHRLHIYHPTGSIKRSYHTDGRAGEAKFDDMQVF